MDTEILLDIIKRIEILEAVVDHLREFGDAMEADDDFEMSRVSST